MTFFKEKPIEPMSHNAGNASRTAGNDRNPGSIGFTQDPSHGFHIPGSHSVIVARPAGQDKQVTTPIIFVDSLVRNIPREYGTISNAKSHCNIFTFSSLFTISDDNQVSVRDK